MRFISSILAAILMICTACERNSNELLNIDLKVGLVSLSSPPDSFITNGLKIEFQWNPVKGVQGYHLQIADNHSFLNPIITCKLDTINYTSNNRLSDGIWYWRVRSFFDDDIFMRWSESRQF
jgi:hypothetical protein